MRKRNIEFILYDTRMYQYIVVKDLGATQGESFTKCPRNRKNHFAPTIVLFIQMRDKRADSVCGVGELWDYVVTSNYRGRLGLFLFSNFYADRDSYGLK